MSATELALSFDPVTVFRLLHAGLRVVSVSTPIPDEQWSRCAKCFGLGEETVTLPVPMGPAATASYEQCCRECGGSGRGSIEVLVYCTTDTDVDLSPLVDFNHHAVISGERLTVATNPMHLGEKSERVSVPLGSFIAKATILSQGRSDIMSDPALAEWEVVVGSVEPITPIAWEPKFEDEKFPWAGHVNCQCGKWQMYRQKPGELHCCGCKKSAAICACAGPLWRVPVGVLGDNK